MPDERRYVLVEGGDGSVGDVLTSNGGTTPASFQAGGGGGITAEQAEDAVAAMTVAGHAMDIAYVDATPTLTFDVDETEFATGPGLITPAMLNNGSALSVLGVTGNAGAARADIAAGTQGHVLHRTATPTVAFGTLIAGAFATGPGIVTPAMLDNGSARSLLGRSVNSAGARADIAGAGAGTAMTDNGTSLAFRAIDISDVQSGDDGVLFGVSPGGGPNVEAISVDSTLSLSGGVLSVVSASALVRILATSVTPQAITNSVTVTDFLAYTIPANTLTAGHAVRVKMGGTFLNNSAAARIHVWSIVLGGTTLWGQSSPNLAANAVECTWEMVFDLKAESSTLVHLTGRLFLSSAVTPTTGLGDIASTSARMDGVFSTVTAGVTVSALSSNRLLSVNFNHPTNTATQTLTRTGYTVELI